MVDHRSRTSLASMGLWFVNQFAQIVHHQMRAMAPKRLSVPLARDADHEPEVPLAPGLDSSEGILDDDRSCRRHPE